MPDAAHRKSEFMMMEQTLKSDYRDVYDANLNSAIRILRRSGYLFYGAAVAAMKKKLKTQYS